MKHFVLIGILLIISSAQVFAETMYVKEVKITLRSDQDLSGSNIVAYLQTGQEVDVQKSDSNWSFIRMSNGKEGWVRSQYLVTEKPKVVSIETVAKDCEKLMVQADSLNEENKRLKEENKRLTSVVTEKEKKFVDINQAYEALKKESADVTKTKASSQISSSQREEQKKKAEILEDQLSELKKTDMIKWFIAGAGVLIVGFVIGFSVKGQRRKSYYM